MAMSHVPGRLTTGFDAPRASYPTNSCKGHNQTATQRNTYGSLYFLAMETRYTNDYLSTVEHVFHLASRFGHQTPPAPVGQAP